MKYLAMAGFNTEQTIAAMPGLLDLAAASATDLGTTSDIASDILTAFNLKASDMGEVGNILTRAFTNSNTDLSMLGETMKYVAPVAASLGMTLDQTAAYAGAMANAGIKASQDGTVLRAAMLRLAAPPKASRDALGKLTGLEGEELEQLQEELEAGAEQLAKLGMSTKDAQGNMRPLVDILEELNVRTKDMGNADKAAVFKNIFGTEASAGMINLAAQADKTIDDTGKQIVDSAGNATSALRKMLETTTNQEISASKVAKKQMDTTGGSLKILSSAWQDAGISVGNLFLPAIQMAAGALSTIANVISATVNRFPLLSKGVALVVGGIIALTAASVAMGLVMNFVRTGLNGFRGGLLRISAASVAATASTTTSTAAAGGFGIASRIAGAGAKFFAGGLRSILMATGVGALLVGLGFAINLLIDNWDAVVATMSAAWAWVTDTWSRLGVFFSELGKNLGAVFSGWGETLSGWVKPVWNWITGVWSGISGFFGSLFDGVANIAGSVWGGIVSLVTSPVEAIKAGWNSIASFFSGLWKGIVSGVSVIGQGILSVFSGAKNAVMAFWSGITGFFSGIANAITGVFAWAMETISSIWQGLADFFSGLWGAITDSAASLWDSVCSLAAWAFDAVSGVWNGAVEFFSGIVNNISAAFAWAYDGIVGIWQGVVEFFGSIGQGISDCFSGVWQGIVDLAAWAWEGIAAVWTGVSEFFGGIVDSIFGVFTGLFDWLKEKFAWVFDTIDAVGSVIGSITGAVKGAWNAAFGEDEKKDGGEKSAASAADKAQKEADRKKAENVSAALSTATASQKPASTAPAAQSPASNAQNAQAAELGKGKTPFIGSDWKPGATPEPQKEKAGGKKKSSGGGSRSRSGASGGGSRSRSGSASGSESGTGAGSGPVTVVTLDSGNEIKTQFIPAAARNAKPLETDRLYGFGENAAANANRTFPPKQPDRGFLTNAASALKSSGLGATIGQGLQAGIGMAKSVLGIGQKQETAAAQASKAQPVQTTILSAAPAKSTLAQTAQAVASGPAAGQVRNGSALQTAGKPALPQAPAMIAKKQGQKAKEQQPGQQGISIDLTQNFDLITLMRGVKTQRHAS